MADVIQRELLLCPQSLLTLQLQTLVGNLTSLLLSLKNMERVTSCRGTVQSKDDTRLSGSGLGDALVALVEHRLDASIGSTGNQVVTHMERTV